MVLSLTLLQIHKFHFFYSGKWIIFWMHKRFFMPRPFSWKYILTLIHYLLVCCVAKYSSNDSLIHFSLYLFFILKFIGFSSLHLNFRYCSRICWVMWLFSSAVPNTQNKNSEDTGFFRLILSSAQIRFFFFFVYK